MTDDGWAAIKEMFNLDPFTLYRVRQSWESGDALSVLQIFREAAETVACLPALVGADDGPRI